jgi:hypothetical protein
MQYYGRNPLPLVEQVVPYSENIVYNAGLLIGVLPIAWVGLDSNDAAAYKRQKAGCAHDEVLLCYKSAINAPAYRPRVENALLPKVREVEELALCEMVIGKLRQFVLFGWGNAYSIRNFLQQPEMSHIRNPNY